MCQRRDKMKKHKKQLEIIEWFIKEIEKEARKNMSPYLKMKLETAKSIHSLLIAEQQKWEEK